MRDISRALEKLTIALDLEREVVGVKFIFSEDEFEKLEAKRPTNMYYCTMVSQATKGYKIKASLQNFYCIGASRALGLIKPSKDAISGQVGFEKLRMYDSLGTAKNVHTNITYIDHEIYGVLIQPLREFKKDPDVVIMIADAYNSMRVIQGYTYTYGTAKSIKMMGNQGICSECTATPYEYNDLNISMLCSNTRFVAKWKDYELGIGMPYNKFFTIVDGIYSTMNSTESDVKKKSIFERANDSKVDLNMGYGENYWDTIRLQ